MSEAQLATRPRASQQLAAFIGMEPNAMLDTIKAQCFRGNPANISNEQLAAFVSIAAEMGVNPLLPGMLYAYPVSGGGVVPIMGPDGVYKKLMEHPEVDSWETEVLPADVSLPPTHAITKIWRKGRERPLQYTALLSEWKVGSNPNWSTRTRHMLSLRSLKQCARQIIHGIPGDEDDRVIMGEINVTPAVPEEKVERAPIPEKKKKGAAAAAAIEVSSTPATTEKGNPAPTQSDAKHAAEVMEAHIAKTEAPALSPAAERQVREEAQLAPKATEKPAEKVAEPVKEPAAPEPALAFIKDGEEIVANVTVKKSSPIFATMDNKRAPSVIATVAGQFNNEVIQHNVEPLNVRQENGKDVFDLPAVWAVGTALKIKLLGKHFPAVKKVYAVVQSVEAVGSASGEGELG